MWKDLAKLHVCFGLSCMQVPALEHNNRVMGESLDLIKYIDTNFEGPSLTPDVSIHDFSSST